MLRFRPEFSFHRKRTSRRRGPLFARTVPLVVSVAVLAGLAARPDLVVVDQQPGMSLVADSYDGFDTKAAEQLRLDQCLMADALRQGGPNMFALAKDSLALPADQLHQKADRGYPDTPFAEAFNKDGDNTNQWVKKAGDRTQAWSGAVRSLIDYPGSPDDEDKIFDRTGLLPWLYQTYFAGLGFFFYDPTPAADKTTTDAVLALGDQLYGTGASTVEAAAWTQWKKQVTGTPPQSYADDSRVFLSSGGFPRTAAQPGTAEFRIAVEDLKTRFASCAWRGPVDPNKVLGKQVAAASAEWQQEIAAQAAPRNQILNANSQAAKALQDGSFALGELLGQSWITDYTTRWQDYWSAGGPGWIGDSPMVVHAHGAADKCLEVGASKKDNGTPVQIYTCNGTAGQKWAIQGDAFVNVNSGKCLEVKGAGTANGTTLQIWTCNNSAAQKWEYNTHATTRMYNPGTGNCLDLATYDNGRDARMWDCKGTDPQKFDMTPSGHNGTNSAVYPEKAQFDTAKAALTAAQAAAKQQLDVLKAQASAGRKWATSSDGAEQHAYSIADQAGAPRGRGLLVGLQKAQVTKASSAALDALLKAGETAEAATRAAAGDSATITARALTQAAASKAAFRTAAANQARAQAKAAADAAAVQANNAKTARDLAKAKLGETQQAEADARAAAATAHARRLDAEKEELTARAEKETAAQKQAEAAQHRQNAEGYATEANQAKGRAEASETTARERRKDAEAARDNAKAKRDDAWDAESRANTARAKADAKEAYAQAHDADDQATASRTAADEADRHASDAESAAVSARSEANAASRAAADADAAATRSEAAATRARAASDAANAAKLKADAAVRTATSTAAEAIQASKAAASSARTAVELADEAEKHAAEAKTHADVAKAEAAKAVAGAAEAAGHAYTTAQAADDARNAAQQVAAPANDAIQLGSPYVATDAVAGLVVLSGQSSKSIAEQQVAVAAAHEANAQKAAAQAQSTANAATGDAKAALVLASEAAGFAAQARKSAKEALGYSAEAAQYAAEAQKSLARTIEYDRQATQDAAAADQSAGRAESYATDARASADQAALDAAAARQAASEAEQAAKDARAAADRADAEATLAEEAAKDAQKYADSAQEAADSSERKEANETVAEGSGTGVGGVFYIVDKMTEAGPAKQLNECTYTVEGCTVTYELQLDVTVSYYFCANPEVPATEAGCPKPDTVFLKTETLRNQKQEWTHHFSFGDITRIGWQNLFGDTVGAVLYEIVLGDIAKCYHGDKAGCAWFASNFIPGKVFEKAAEAIRALDAAMKTGVGVADAMKALKALDLDTATLAKIQAGVNAYEDVVTTCKVNSFPGDTLVLMADGRRKAIRDVREGDQVMATDPGDGRLRAEQVTDTFRHDTERLVTIGLAGGSSLNTTAGHKIRTSEGVWVLASELRPGDRLLGPDGTSNTVTGMLDRSGLAPRKVYDLTVSGLHTFYVRTEGAAAVDVLVHNCLNLGDENLSALADYAEEIHTLKDHVNRTPAQAFALAVQKNEPKTIWTSQEIAQQAVDRVVGDFFSKRATNGQKIFDEKKWKKFQDWAAKARDGEQYQAITGTWDAYPSLGKTYFPDGTTVRNAGNEVVVILMKVRNHKGDGRYGFVVKTAYPK